MLPAGFEPATIRLRGGYSDQLSYKSRHPSLSAPSIRSQGRRTNHRGPQRVRRCKRREGDSNPRASFLTTHLAGGRLQPLSHLSRRRVRSGRVRGVPALLLASSPRRDSSPALRFRKPMCYPTHPAAIGTRLRVQTRLRLRHSTRYELGSPYRRSSARSRGCIRERC